MNSSEKISDEWNIQLSKLLDDVEYNDQFVIDGDGDYYFRLSKINDQWMFTLVSYYYEGVSTHPDGISGSESNVFNGILQDFFKLSSIDGLNTKQVRDLKTKVKLTLECWIRNRYDPISEWRLR